MGRPYVQVPTENRLAQLREHLSRTLPVLRRVPGLEGITLNGGMSRGYADHLSEVDVTLYLNEAAYGEYQRGESPIPSGITVVDGQLYDIKIGSLAADMDAHPSPVALWDASYAEILYDPEGKVAALYAKHLAGPPKVEGAGGSLFDCWWHFRLAGDIWIHRQDGLQANLIMNRAIEPLVKSLFIANGEYVPHEKWLIHMSRSLDWRPLRWEERLAEAMTIAAPTVEVARDRQAAIFALWDEIDRHAVTAYFPGFPLRLMQKHHYDLLLWLAGRGQVTLQEWTARAGGTTLSSAPFHACTAVEGNQVRLDQDRLRAIQPTEMYSWFYEIVEAVRNGAGTSGSF